MKCGPPVATMDALATLWKSPASSPFTGEACQSTTSVGASLRLVFYAWPSSPSLQKAKTILHILSPVVFLIPNAEMHR